MAMFFGNVNPHMGKVTYMFTYASSKSEAVELINEMVEEMTLDEREEEWDDIAPADRPYRKVTMVEELVQGHMIDIN